MTESKDTQATEKKTDSKPVTKTVAKPQAKESSKKLTIAKKKYFVPAAGKSYKAASLVEATQMAAKELKKEYK